MQMKETKGNNCTYYKIHLHHRNLHLQLNRCFFTCFFLNQCHEPTDEILNVNLKKVLLTTVARAFLSIELQLSKNRESLHLSTILL